MANKINLGPDVKPTGRLRMLQNVRGTSARLQMQWRGEFGSAYFDVPIVVVHDLPPHNDGDS